MITLGILAHVDAGKTTLSEALLYECGAIRKLGRVDSKNAFLDNNSIERERGITIFSKQAILNEKITLIDTPGHVDFSAESIDDTCGIAVERNSIQGVVAAIEKIMSQRGIAYTVDDCLRRARIYDRNYRFLEYIQEVYEGI